MHTSMLLFPGPWSRTVLLSGLLFTLGCATTRPRPVVQGPLVPATAGSSRPGPVLFLLSSAPQQTLANGKSRSTGFFLGEFFEAWRAIRDAGLEVVFATPEGAPPVVDPESIKPSYWKSHPEWLDEAQALVANDEGLKRPLSLSEALAREARFTGLVVPGGQGVMVDLLSHKDVPSLLVRFGETGRPVGLICHAPALLTRLQPEADPFRGRAVTSVSGFEEFFIETFIMGGRARDRDIGGQLTRRGYDHRTAFAGRPFAVRDGNLVTSQNPYSGEEFWARYRDALAAYLESKSSGER